MMEPFWLAGGKDGAAIVESGAGAGTDAATVTYAELDRRAAANAGRLPQKPGKSLGLLLCTNETPAITMYLGALRAGHALMLLDAGMHRELLVGIIDTYDPDWIAAPDRTALPVPAGHYHRCGQEIKGEYSLWTRTTRDRQAPEPHPELALLLATSGTTGSAKMVRLSYRNLQANAASIAEYLAVGPSERGLLTLPMQYSYGLSVINSHLLAGAAVLLTKDNMMSKPFWSFLREQEATSFPGVPYTYQMLHRLRFHEMDLPSLRYHTQAGGRLAPELVRYFREAALTRGRKFYVMYGQTEATARMSYVPWEGLADKEHTIGVPIPGGAFSLDPETSELIYEGPNVMMGYAWSRDDLAKGDELGGRLHTGDLAAVDAEGYYTIIGRKQRFIKIFGLRIHLDEVERQVEEQFGAAVFCLENDDRLAMVLEAEDQAEVVKAFVRERYKLHASAVAVHVVPELPRQANGKPDYAKAKEWIR